MMGATLVMRSEPKQFVLNIKMGYNRNRLLDLENRLVVAKAEVGWGRDGVGV